MKVEVDRSLCQGHGQCALAAADVFQLDHALNLHYDPEPPEELRDAVEEAVMMCPTQAIALDTEK
jgi:ferredoxin